MVLKLVHNAWLEMQVPLAQPPAPCDMKSESEKGHKSHQQTKRIQTAIHRRAGGPHHNTKLITQHAKDQYEFTWLSVHAKFEHR